MKTLTQRQKNLKAWKQILFWLDNGDWGSFICPLLNCAFGLSRETEKHILGEVFKEGRRRRKSFVEGDAVWLTDQIGMKDRLAFVNRQIRKLSPRKKVKR